MATTEPLNALDRIEKVEGVNGVEEGSSVGAVKSEGSSAKAEESSSTTSATKPASPSKDVSPARQDQASGTASTRSTPVNGSAPTPSLSMPHPKKFSHIDINKRFLEKNSAASSTGHAASPSIANKSSSALQKPATPTTVTHSRLVTAKLTTDIQRSSTTGPGWSRPSSASSSAAPTPSATIIGPKALPTPSSSAAPQLPVAGKVIQPQPRGVVEAAPLSRKDSAGKIAWGATKPATVVQITPDATSEEFPTAAEAAQAKHVEKKTSAPTDEKKQPQATDEEADAFRGRHLDPNVHHWDDDDNDDSNFLDEVIEFDDGRQYTVQPTQDDAGGKPDEAHNVPVSKEERFADDFDRSWPPSRPAKHPTESPQQPLRSPTVSSQSMHSPQDSSRVLFNERSNRLEPYSSSRFGGPSRDSFPRRGSRSDMATSPVESRNGRDGPVQLLQKPGHGNRDSYFPDDRSRRGSFTPSHDNSRFRDRDGPRRDFPNGFEHGRSRDQFERNGGPSDRTRRMSNVSSSHLSPVDSPREGRQLPPHLSGTHPTPSMWRAPSERSRRLSTASSVSIPPVRQASHSPASTHAPLSPALGDTALVSSPAVDIDEVRKAAMHSAAERARLRRQQEEEEREKERERARRKAAEIEAKLKAADQAKAVISASESKGSVDSEVVSIIEDAVKSATQSVEPLPAVPEEPSTVPTFGPEVSRPPAVRAPSSRGAPRPPRRLSVDGPSPAAEVDSWRSKARPRPPAEHAPEPASTTAPGPPPPMGLINHVDHLSLTGNEDLEVVDFHEHGKLIGVHADDSGSVEPVSTSASTDSVSRRLRPVASDFFHDHHETLPPPVDNTPSSWRRRPSVAQEESRLALVPIQTTESTTAETAVDEQVSFELQTTTMPSYPSSSGHARPPLTIEPGHPHPDHQSDYANPLRSPYRQAPMAALTDTMARIKGAIDGMHHKPEPEPRQKWVPPARRPPQTPTDVVVPHPSHHHAHAEHDEHIVREVFDVTGYEPPRSPKPAWNHFMVRFPRHSQERAPLSLQQMRILGSRLYTRLDVISLIPTGDRRREPIWNVNDQLFSKPYFVKGRLQCTVKLPRTSGSAEAEGSASQPVVNLPAKSNGGRAATNGAFGRSRDADGLSNWRKPPASPLRQQTDLLAPPVGGLDTVSRSPPPETPSRTSAEPGKLQGSAEAPVITVPPTKTKAQPNSTENPAVAFYRDSPNNVTGRQTPPVKFVVNSELEDAGAKTLDGAVQGSSTQSSSHVSFSSLQLSTVNTATPEQPLHRESLSSSKDPIVEMRKGNPAGPITPPSHPGNLPSLTWAAQREAALKESPSRPPDPEHLKAVWSSTSNKPEKPAVNSLRNIADDLNAPLTQNAKMEDIPTPPPHASTSTHASRMSIMHDITRQFQQVPTPSGPSSHTASHTHAPSSQSSNSHPPPSMTSPAQRPPQLPPSASSGMRLPYPGYPSPMMSSPSPTLVYSQAMTPSPIPQQMMASSPYGQPMWVPMPPGSGPGMMRPMGSPYGAQLMPYPPAGTMYAPPPNMQGPGMPASPSVPGRPPANVMLTPSGSQGQPSPYPMYAASPVMMHAMPAPAQNYPGPAQPRGPPPPRGAYDPHHAPAGMQPSPSYGPPQSPAYPQMQPNMYVRQGW